MQSAMFLRRTAPYVAAATVSLWSGAWLPATAAEPRDALPPSPSARCAAPGAVRSLADVLARVAGGPRSEVLAARVRAAEALRDQAAARLNPGLSLTGEDLTGSGPYRNLGQSETTLSLSQRIELGGQRDRRIEAAERDTDVERAKTALESARTALVARRAWIDLLAGRLLRDVAAESEAVVGEVLSEVKRRQDAGASSQADLDRASIAAATASLERADAERRERVAAAGLVALWNGSVTDVECVRAELPLPAKPDAEGPPTEADATLPAVLVAEREVEARRAAVAAARAQAWPDFQVGAGARYLAGPGDVSLVANLGVEVPVFDRNAGNVRAAEEELVAAQARAATTRSDAAVDLLALRADVESARNHVLALDATMLPAAARAFETLRKAWREGAASTVEVLEARRALATLRTERISALARFHHAVASVDATTGRIPAPLAGEVPPSTDRPARDAGAAR